MNNSKFMLILAKNQRGLNTLHKMVGDDNKWNPEDTRIIGNVYRFLIMQRTKNVPEHQLIKHNYMIWCLDNIYKGCYSITSNKPYTETLYIHKDLLDAALKNNNITSVDKPKLITFQ